MDRRKFLATSSVAAAGAILSSVPGIMEAKDSKKKGNALPQRKKIALVGTGSRGTKMWGKSVIEAYSDVVEYVGLCDTNPGRLEAAKQYMGATCKTFTDFETMMSETKPDILIVTVVDALHDQFIIRGLELGCDVITKNP
jgi:predicted dehydrogenase